MKYLSWLLKAAIFFTLFAFALNNQQDATVHFFFGTQLRGPLVLVVLAAFATGLAVGALGMVPRWWKHRVAARRAQQAHPSDSSVAGVPTQPRHAEAAFAPSPLALAGGATDSRSPEQHGI